MNEELTTHRRNFNFLLTPFFAETCLHILSFSITIPSKIITSTVFTIPVRKIVLKSGEYQQDVFCWHSLNFIEHFLKWQNSIL